MSLCDIICKYYLLQSDNFCFQAKGNLRLTDRKLKMKGKRGTRDRYIPQTLIFPPLCHSHLAPSLRSALSS